MHNIAPEKVTCLAQQPIPASTDAPVLPILAIGSGWLPEHTGGLERFYYECAMRLPEVGIDFHGLVIGSDQVAASTNQKITAFASAQQPLWQRWLGLRQAWNQHHQKQSFALIASHFSLYTFPILDKIRRYPTVMHFQGPWAMEGSLEGRRGLNAYFKKWIEKACYQNIDRFIVLSDAFRSLLHQEYDVPLDRIHVIPAAVEVQQFQTALTQQEARQKLGWVSDRPTMLVVRRLANRMGLENLITAMATVRQQYPEVLLKIAGKGALRSALEQQIQALNLQDQVELLGFVPDEDLPLAYRAADFSVVPTVDLEGFGLIVIESLAAGTPVLGTPVCAIPEILAPLSSDLLFSGIQPEQLAQGILEVLSGQRRLPSREACQIYVEQHYNWARVTQQIREVYQTAIDAHTTSPKP